MNTFKERIIATIDNPTNHNKLILISWSIITSEDGHTDL
jgi:hypothetical protein